MGVAAAGTAKDLQVLSTGTLKFVGAAGAAGVASVGLAGVLGAGLGGAFAAAGVGVALLNKNVQDTFKNLGTNLKGQLASVSKPVQDAMLDLAKYIKTSFSTMKPLFANFFQAVAPLVTIFGQGLVKAIANVVGEFTPLARTVTPIVQELFAQLPDLIGNIAFALKLILAPLSGNTAAFGQFLQTIGSLLPIVGSIIGALVRLGQQIMPTFQRSILAVGTALDGTLIRVLPLVGKAITTMLPPIARLAAALLPALGAILRALLPVLSSVVAALAGALAKVLPQVVPGFVALIQVVGQLLGAVKPLLPSLTYLAVWISRVANNLLSAILPVIVALLNGLMPALKVILPIIIQVANQVGNALAVAFKQAQPSLVLVARAVGQLLTALAPLIPVVVTAALAFLPIIPAAAKIAAVLATGLVPIVLALTPLLVFLAPTLVKLAIGVKLWAVAQGILNVVLTANPIGIVIVAVAALAAGIIYAYKHSDTFRKIVQTAFSNVRESSLQLWHAIVAAVHGIIAAFDATTHAAGNTQHFIVRAWQDIRDWVLKAWHGINDAMHALVAAWDWVKRAAGTTRDAIVRAWNAVLSWFKAMPGAVLRALGNGLAWLGNFGHNVISGLWTGIKAKWDEVIGWFKGLPSKILGALGIHSPPDWAISAGKHVMGGILKGLAHGVGDVAGFFRGLASSVTGPLASVWASINAALFSGPGIGPTNFGSNRALVRGLAEKLYGWTGGQWIALANLVSGESGFNNRAQNPTSSAFGMFQFLDSTWASVGAAKTADPYAQTVAGLRYIAGRYGSPAAAYGAWLGRSPHWYAEGGIFTRPAIIGVGERGAEAVVPLGRLGTVFTASLRSWVVPWLRRIALAIESLHHVSAVAASVHRSAAVVHQAQAMFRPLTAAQLNALPDLQRWAYVKAHGLPKVPAGYIWGEDFSLVRRSFDQGGWLQPGLTLAYNGTGRPERVGGGATVVLQLQSPTIIGSDLRKASSDLLQGIREDLRRRGKGATANLL